MNKGTEMIKKYYETNSLVAANLRSFDDFIETGMQRIVHDLGDIVPTVIPQDMEDFRIKLDKVWVEKPQITEADGSKRDIYPTEARLRKITYSGPINLEISAHIDGVQRESFTTQIGKIPIMLKSKYCHLNKLSKDDLIKAGVPYEKSEFPWLASGKALAIDRIEGKTKLLFDPQNKKIISAGIVGPNAGDLIGEAVLAIEMGADVEDIALSIHPHPTLSETIANAAEMFSGTITDLYAPK